MKRKKVKKVHPFEYIGAHKLYTEGRFLLADEMGMFKTAQAIFANSKFRQKNKSMRSLIVAPTAVKEHWARELQEWAYPRGDINVVDSSNVEAGIRAAKNSTWTIVTHPQMSRLNNGLLGRLSNTGFGHVIIDEVHNAKNPDALRTKAMKTLTDRADNVSLLSGTPIPNTMSDLYVLMSMLDPEQFPFDPEKDSSDAENFRIARQSFIQLYVARPQAVKELLHRKMLRRAVKDYLSAHIPEAHFHRVEVPLAGQHLETYQEIVEQEMNVGRKMMELAKASLDPCLVDPSLPDFKPNGRDISSKYEALEEIIDEEMRKRKGKALIFTGLKTDVVSYLEDKFSPYGVVAITGDVSTGGGIREEMRRQFQHDSQTRVMIATTTMNEGVDLTAATAVIDLTIPMTPAERHQRWKRSHRPGEIEKDKVDIYTLYTTVPGTQASLDVALLDMVDAKEEIVSYLTRGMQVSLEELKTYDRTEKVPRIVRAITSPSKAIFDYFLRWRGVGAESANRRMQRSPETSRFIAELYPGFSMARNAADIYVPIIKALERKRPLARKVDIGCGPGMLGFFLQEPTVGVDINPDMIEEGKELYPENELHVGGMHDLPLEDRTADLTVCSLAYQMSEPKRERAQALREMSRVLRNRGYAIITVPGKYMDSRDITRFEEVAGAYGLAVKQHEQLVGKSKIDFYVFQKVRAPVDEIFSLRWVGDPGGKKKK